MNNKHLYKALLKYNLKVKEVFPFEKGYRNKSYPILLKNGDKVNLILYKNEPGILERIKRTNLISNYLSEKGFPTRKSYFHKNNTDLIKIKSENQIRYLSLYNYLEGSTIPWEGYTMKLIKLLGKTMAEMHKAINNEELTNSFPKVADELMGLSLRMKKYFADENVKSALKRKLNLEIDINNFNKFERLMKTIEKLSNHQILHMDFVRSNVLFSHEKSKLQITNYKLLETDNLFISGILDFEKTSFGPTIVDIARTLAFLIIDCKYKTEQKIRKYFLFSGYQKRGNIELTNLELLNPLMNFFLTYDFYKFLKHNPYDFLEQNEHFKRTRDKLLKGKMIIKVKN